jgi:hypothetical protein
VNDPWSKAVYDGLGLEGESEPPVLRPACTACGVAMELALRRVLDGEAVRPSDPDAEELARRFGLARREGAWPRLTTDLGLEPYRVELACSACGAAHLAVVGYGEFQPARWVAVLQGVGGA